MDESVAAPETWQRRKGNGRLGRTFRETVGRLWDGRWRLRGYLPFTNWNLVWRHLDKQAETVLDIGCGKGRPMRFLNRGGGFLAVGVDSFEPYLEQCQREGSHGALVLGDATSLPFREKSFDTVLCLQVFEHFEKETAGLLLNQMERLARKQVIVTTDVGEFVQSKAIDGNPMQVHKYVWSVDELQALGFRVLGTGLRGHAGETGVLYRLPAPLRWLLGTMLGLVAGPVVYHHPRYAATALCIKDARR